MFTRVITWLSDKLTSAREMSSSTTVTIQPADPLDHVRAAAAARRASASIAAFGLRSAFDESTESHSHAATSDSIEAEGEFEPSLLLLIAVFTLPAFFASLILAQDPVYNVAFLADRLRTLLIYACIAIVPLSVLHWVIHMAFHPVDNWWIWQLQLWIFNWDSCADLTVCYDEHGRPCQWVAPLAKDYCASLDELYG